MQTTHANFSKFERVVTRTVTSLGPRFFGTFAALLVVLGCQAKAEPEKKKSPAPAPVVLERVGAEPFVETRQFFGEVRATSDASLSALESGRVKAVLVDEGDQVEKGQVLVELDDQLARVQLNEAVANKKETETRSEQARLELEKYAQMQKEQVVSELEATRKASEAQSLEAASQSGAARVARGAELLRRHRIVAPFDGTVTLRNVDPGDYLQSGDSALQLLTSGHFEIDVRVPASVLQSLDDLKEVAIVAGGRRAAARLEGSVHALDPKTRTALLRVTPTEPAPWLLVGAGVYVELSVARSEGWNVPRDALVYGVATPRIYLTEKGKVRPLEVEVLATSKDRALVKAEGLSEDAKIVVRGNERLRPGQAVTEEGALVPKGASK